MRHEAVEDVVSLVKPASVHRSLYDDPAIFEIELERVFGSAWIYVGHESQVRNAGDYFCTQVGRKPIVVVRGPDGALHVLHNQCAHRGAMVVEAARVAKSLFFDCGMRPPVCISAKHPVPYVFFDKPGRKHA